MGMILAADFGCRARLGDEPWLEDETAVTELARVVDEAVPGYVDEDGGVFARSAVI